MCFSRRKWEISLSECPDSEGVMGMETRNARRSRHGDGDQDTETFKAEIIPRTWISFGRTGSDLFVNKHQELSVTGYNERGSFVPLLLDLWQAQLPGIKYFQAFPKSSNHRAKKPRHSRLPPARAREGHSHGIQLQWHREGNSHPRIESSRTRRRNVREGTF